MITASKEDRKKVYEGIRAHYESEAIFLFGRLVESVCREDATLGEYDLVFTGNYPDAVLRVKEKSGNEIYLAIAFEGRSSNFAAHGHDYTKCDLIVCLYHDWKECPILVVEVGGIPNVFKPGEESEIGFLELLRSKRSIK
ncbi:MAG: hypothetical protein M1503_03785 [Thaumarchaeota archaeon]|nr:hypothetical protein [Nitrososphaerota archaeon]MCL5317375.1 hypothetical protein [Nitrososphaerota archaeon]